MRYIFFLFSFYSCYVLGQTTAEPTPGGLKVQQVKITLTSPENLQLKFPFYEIVIRDYRFDTSKIGFSRDRFAFSKERSIISFTDFGFHKMIFKDGLTHTLEDFYKGCYKACFSKDSTRLLILVKRFWADPFPNVQAGHRQMAVSPEDVFDLHIQFELLLERNQQYMPVRRIDTIFKMDIAGKKVGYKDDEGKFHSIFEHALTSVLESVNYRFYADRFDVSKNKKTLDEVIKFSEQRFKYPILKDSVLREGVYLNFSEFRNNRPSVSGYKVETKRRIGKVLYNKTDKDSSQIVDYWGYCDGHNIYCNDLEHPLQKCGNTFEFFMERKEEFYTNVPVYAGAGTIPATASVKSSKKTLEPFQIDMETGKIY